MPLANQIAVRSFAWESPPDAPSYSVQEFESSCNDIEAAVGRAERALQSTSLEAAIAILLDAAKTLVSELEGMQ